MPEVALTEAVLGALALLGVGGGVGATIRKPRPGTPEDHELRLVKVEAADKDCDERLDKLEARMSTIEASVAGALGRLTESVTQQGKAVEKLAESVDGLRACVNELDVEARVEREVKARLEARRRPKTDTDPSEGDRT